MCAASLRLPIAPAPPPRARVCRPARPSSSVTRCSAQLLCLEGCGPLAAQPALLLELAPLGALAWLTVVYYEGHDVSHALLATLAELCCGCAGLRRVDLSVAGLERSLVPSEQLAWHDGIEGLRATLALRGRAGVAVNLDTSY